MSVICTEKAAGAVGPYSQGIKCGPLVFVSGQLPIDAKTGEFPSDKIEGQTEQSLKNVKAVLAAAGAGMKEVVKTTVFLQDMGDFAAMNSVYRRFFSSDCPARSCFQVGKLPKDARVEIEVIAFVK